MANTMALKNVRKSPMLSVFVMVLCKSLIPIIEIITEIE